MLNLLAQAEIKTIMSYNNVLQKKSLDINISLTSFQILASKYKMTAINMIV